MPDPQLPHYTLPLGLTRQRIKLEDCHSDGKSRSVEHQGRQNIQKRLPGQVETQMPAESFLRCLGGEFFNTLKMPDAQIVAH